MAKFEAEMEMTRVCLVFSIYKYVFGFASLRTAFSEFSRSWRGGQAGYGTGSSLWISTYFLINFKTVVK